MSLVVSLLIQALILGAVIWLMTGDAFPGFMPLVGCILAMGFVGGAITYVLPKGLGFLGVIGGAAVVGLLLSWWLGMSRPQAFKAVGIYFVTSLIVGLLLGL